MNKNITLLFLLVLTLLLAISVVSAADSNSTTDTSYSTSIDDNSASISETSNSNSDTNEVKSTSDTSYSTQEVKTSNNEVKSNENKNISQSNTLNTKNSDSNSQDDTDSESSNTQTTQINKSNIETSNNTYSTSNTKTSNSVNYNSNTSTNNLTTNNEKELQNLTIDNKDQLKSSTSYNVYNYNQLVNAISDIKSNTVDTSYTINLQMNSSTSAYYITDSVYFTGSSSLTKNVTINGNGVTIDGRDKYQFMNISSSYSVNINDLIITNCNSTEGGVFTNYGNLTLNNVTVKNTNGSHNGGITNSGQLLINNSTFTNNTGFYGGVIENSFGYISISNSTFENNTGDVGGVIYNSYSVVNINNSILSNNYGYNGGVIYNYRGSTASIRNTLFTNNSGFNGGVFYNTDNSNIFLTNSSLINNYSPNDGVIIFAYNNVKQYIGECIFENNSETDYELIFSFENSETDIINSSFNNNKAIIEVRGDSTLYIINSSFQNNNPYSTSGIVYSRQSNLTVINSTFNNNSFTAGWGVIYNLNSNVTIYNSIFDNDNREIYNSGSNSIITNNQFIDNKFSSYTIYNKNGNMTFTNNNIFSYYTGYANHDTTIKSPLQDLSLDDDCKVTYIIDGKTYTPEKDVNGTIYLNYVFNNTGEHEVTVVFDSIYDQNNITLLITTSLAPCSIVLFNITNTTLGFKVIISGMLYDNNNKTLDNQMIILTINNVNYTTTTENGFFRYEYTPTEIGINNVTVTFNGDNDKYQTISVTTTFYIGPKLTYINIYDISDTTFNRQITISGNLKDFGNYLKNTTIILSINGNNVSVVTDNSGNFYYNYTTSVIGTNNITATFEGNESYDFCNDSRTFYVSQANTKIEINSINNTNIASTVNISGTLKDTYNKAVPETYVTLLINNKEYNVKTNSNGIFSLNYTVNTVGLNNITVTFDGNENYTSSTNSTSFNVTKIKTNIIIDSINNSNLDSIITITGSLLDKNNNALTYMDILLNIDGTRVTLTTNNYGIFSYNYYASTLGINNITVTYDGNEIYENSSTSTIFYITQSSKIQLNPINDTTVGETVIISGTLKDINDDPIKNVNVSVTIDGKKYINSTNSNGVFSISYYTTKTGVEDIIVLFEGNNEYSPTNTSTTLNILFIDTVIVLEPINDSYVNDLIYLKGTLKDINGNPIKNAKIYLSYEDEQIETNSEGVFRKNYYILTEGTYTITATFEGNYKYSSSKTSVTFNVNKENTTITINPIEDTTIYKKISISGQLTNIENYGLYMENITISINGQGVVITTDQKGYFNYSYNTTTSGINNITVSYEGNYRYSSSNVYITIDVKKISTNISITLIGNKNVNNYITIYGSLKDEKNFILANATLILTINQKNITITTNSNGIYSYEYQITSVGTYDITIYFEGNMSHNSSNNKITFNVTISTRITINSIGNTTIGNTITITGTLKDTNENNISNAVINLSINGDSIVVKTNSNGVYTYQYTTTNKGINNITATYDGDNYYISSSTKTTFNVLNVASNLVIEQITTKNGYTVTLTAKVTDSDGNPINTGQATFKLNGVTMKDNGTQIKVNVVNGLAQYNFTIPNYSAKEYKLTAVYGYLDTRLEDSTTLVILKSDPELKLTSITSNGTTGKITGMLLDEHGVGVDRETKVSVKINGKTILSTRIYEGVIDLEFDTSAYKNGIHNLTVIFGENGCYNTVTYEGAIAQNVKDTIVVNPVTGKNGDIVSFRAYIIDENGNSATNGSATFKLNGVTVKENGTQIKVNFVNGVAEYNFTIPDYSAKDYNLTAVASVGATRYEAQTVLTIEKTDTHVQLNPITITQGSNATVTGSILDEHNNPITIDTKVSVKINGKTVSNTRVYDGLIDVPIDTSSYSKGNYTIDFVAGENGRYNKSTSSTTLTIK